MLSQAEQIELEEGLGEYTHNNSIWQYKYFSEGKYQIGYPKEKNFSTIDAKAALEQVRSAKSNDWWTPPKNSKVKNVLN